jgi:ABC-2 type transport system permease protein
MTALLEKELLDAVRNRAALFPVALVSLISLLVPLVVVFVIPALTGHGLGEDADLVRVSGAVPPAYDLSPDGRVQVFLLQQFLLLFLLTPISGAMSFAAHAVVGEKQARTLEPLLATPITTADLLIAKVLGAAIPTLVISTAALLLYFGAIAVLAEPGVTTALFGVRTFLLLLLVGPASALVSLQLALLVSSRVNDARAAQQFGVLIILPLSGLVVAQFVGVLMLPVTGLVAVGIALAVIWLLLLLVSVALFDRESILTRWR